MDFEDVLIPLIFMMIGVGGFFLINNAVLTAEPETWTFTGAALAGQLLPLAPWLWLFACIIIAGIGLWREL